MNDIDKLIENYKNAIEIDVTMAKSILDEWQIENARTDLRDAIAALQSENKQLRADKEQATIIMEALIMTTEDDEFAEMTIKAREWLKGINYGR